MTSELDIKPPYLFQSGNNMLEVVLTGRVATKTTGRGKEITLYEIEALDQDLEFKQWVKLDQLFTVKIKQ